MAHHDDRGDRRHFCRCFTTANRIDYEFKISWSPDYLEINYANVIYFDLSLTDAESKTTVRRRSALMGQKYKSHMFFLL